MLEVMMIEKTPNPQMGALKPSFEKSAYIIFFGKPETRNAKLFLYSPDNFQSIGTNFTNTRPVTSFHHIGRE